MSLKIENRGGARVQNQIANIPGLTVAEHKKVPLPFGFATQVSPATQLGSVVPVH